MVVKAISMLLNGTPSILWVGGDLLVVSSGFWACPLSRIVTPRRRVCLWQHDGVGWLLRGCGFLVYALASPRRRHFLRLRLEFVAINLSADAPKHWTGIFVQS